MVAVWLLSVLILACGKTAVWYVVLPHLLRSRRYPQIGSLHLSACHMLVLTNLIMPLRIFRAIHDELLWAVHADGE